MPRIDYHAALYTLRARYNTARRILERVGAESHRLEALDALQACLEQLTPSTLSCDAWQSMALLAFRVAFDPGPLNSRQLYAGGLLVFCHSTGTEWTGDWKNELLDAA